MFSKAYLEIDPKPVISLVQPLFCFRVSLVRALNFRLGLRTSFCSIPVLFVAFASLFCFGFFFSILELVRKGRSFLVLLIASYSHIESV